ncbi:MBL fold metallo-hydrolase [Salimicrobium flavidum]|uniref:Hydroxyacylglutathione hydrolase n=1 Tax=Salimicrobium flavidum TaxID=570947 RepID=A0A1N7ITC5_9BACI|nr:MBL fold metallo-hydrolase [Salimicrobium flavidum]SIS40287.1 hydroxyacylglutathione hydrolase [Salimicrobium flavidum]
MLLKHFYDNYLAQASYLVGCQATGEAVVVDPAREIEPYIEAANQNGLRITGALETHIHADFVSGGREMAERLGATLYVSDEGDSDWKYENIDHLPHQLLKDGDEVKVGNVKIGVIHTPGHTPESLSFTLKDGGTDNAMGVFTGDFLFVGDVGRPDLLEKAAGAEGTAEKGGYQMFESLQKFSELPDFLQIWPGHGAGSACGKSLGSVPQSTLGYEKQENWVFQHDNAEEFVKELTDGQPAPPVYFAEMKKVNKVGPGIVRELNDPKRIDNPKELEEALDKGVQVLDTRDSARFAKSHVKGTYNIPFNKSFANWAGWIVDYDRDLYILTEDTEHQQVLAALRSIGIDKVTHYMEASQAVTMSSRTEHYHNYTPEDSVTMIEKGEAKVLDVRSEEEYEEAHIEGAAHIYLGELPNRIEEVPGGRPLIVQCGSGARSAIATSILQAHGITDVRNMDGGFSQWKNQVNKLIEA